MPDDYPTRPIGPTVSGNSMTVVAAIIAGLGVFSDEVPSGYPWWVYAVIKAALAAGTLYMGITHPGVGNKRT